MRGVVPLVAAMVGPCAAGTAYIPGLADFVPMVKGQRRDGARRAAPRKAVTGQDITQAGARRLEGPLPKSGVGDVEVADDARVHRRRQGLPLVLPVELRGEAADRAEPTTRSTGCDEELLDDRSPSRTRKPYDMYEVIREIVDDGEIFDIKPKFAKTIITCLARIGGRPVGIVANQPKQLGGILENDSADKAARFINLCDAFNMPLVFLQDVPGFMVGSKVEHAGIIRHGAKMLHAVSRRPCRRSPSSSARPTAPATT